MSQRSERMVGGERARRFFRRLRTEGNTPRRQAAAFGLGIFIGCLPVFGFHFSLCLLAGWVFGLNRLKVYLAAHVSNPVLAPFLLFGEIQTGRWLRVGAPYPLSLDAFRAFDLWEFGADLVVGSIVVGLVLGAAVAAGTYAAVRRAGRSPAEAGLVDEAIDRYAAAGIIAWEFANAKIRLDPVYRDVLRRGLLPSEGTLLDLGCGRGFMLTLLAVARERSPASWPADWPAAPSALVLRGIERRPRVAAIARQALGEAGTIEHGDVQTFDLPASDAVLMFDLLHMMPYEAQDTLLARVAASLQPRGVLIIREADAAAGWRCRVVQVANWLKGVGTGALRRRLYFRTADEWARRLELMGLVVRPCSPKDRRLLANVMIEATRTVRE